MKTMSLKEVANLISCPLFFVKDKETGDPLFSISIERKIYYECTDNDDVIHVTFGDIDCDSTFYTKNLLRWFDKNSSTINKNLFYDYIEKFTHIHNWLVSTYIPKFKDRFGDDFHDIVIKYLENDVYLFCCSFDNLSGIEESIGHKRKII